MEKLKIYSRLSPVISRGRVADQALVAFQMMATGLSTTNDKKGNCQLIKKNSVQDWTHATIQSIGEQDTLDEEMMAEYNYQIETPISTSMRMPPTLGRLES
jgi:hypothetical protein